MDSNYEAHSLLSDEDKDLPTGEKWPRDSRRNWNYTRYLPLILLACSICLNIFQAVNRYNYPAETKGISEYVGLENSKIQIQWPQTSVYTDTNNTIADTAWDAIDHDSGIVAVPKEWAISKNLSLGSTFPWDSSKSIYFVNAYHGLHCLKNIYRAFSQYRDGVPQSLPYHHITHCLDQLRADVICHADDTPRVTTNDMRPVTGEGQWRTCRDWSKLEAWTFENPGCFRYGDPTAEDEKPSQIARMRYCPDDSILLDRVREYFGKGSDWFPDREKKFSWAHERLNEKDL